MTTVETKEMIIQQTIESLAGSNPDKMSLDEVAARSGISKSTIFWHFENKEGLLLAAIDKIFQDFVGGLQVNFQRCESPMERIDLFLEKYAEFCRDRPEINIIILNFMIQKRNHEIIREKLRSLFQDFRGYILDNLGVERSRRTLTGATLVIGALDGVFMQWLIDPENIDLKESYAQIKFLMKALLVKEG